MWRNPDQPGALQVAGQRQLEADSIREQVRAAVQAAGAVSGQSAHISAGAGAGGQDRS